MVVGIRMGITMIMVVGTTITIIIVGIVGVGATRGIVGRMIIRWGGLAKFQEDMVVMDDG